jgi:hypothetical protein
MERFCRVPPALRERFAADMLKVGQKLRRGHGTFRRETDLQRGWGIDVNTRRDEIRWGAATSIAFGSFGWMIGVTIPPWLPGTNFVPSLLFSLAMGAFGFIPGDIAGKTVAATRIRRV